MVKEQKKRIGGGWYTDVHLTSTFIALLFMTASAVIRAVYFWLRAVPPSVSEWIAHLLLPPSIF